MVESGELQTGREWGGRGSVTYVWMGVCDVDLIEEEFGVVECLVLS